jgi:hypothetical protein
MATSVRTRAELQPMLVLDPSTRLCKFSLRTRLLLRIRIELVMHLRELTILFRVIVMSRFSRTKSNSNLL